MNKQPDYAFDPSFKEQHLKSLGVRDDYKGKCANDSRKLFYQLNQPINYPNCISSAYDFISCALQEVNQVNSSAYVKHTSQDKFSLLQITPIPPLSDLCFTQANLHKCLNQTSAILLTQPRWLENVFQTFSSQSKVAVELMSIYLKLTRTEQGQLNLIEACRSLLLATNIRIPALHSYSYSQQTEILPEMMHFACIQLALAHFPRVLFPELLGFTLAYFQIPTLVEVCFPDHQLPVYFFKLRGHHADQQVSSLLQCISDYLDLYPNREQSLWDRIQNGFWLYHTQMQRCRDSLDQLLEKPESATQAVAKLFQQKAMAAIGHHQKIQLQEKSLDGWFSGMPENSHEFLQALRQSRYVDNKTPENSPLLKLFSFKGPMFGVLNESELTLLQNWLVEEEKPTSNPSALEQATIQSAEKISRPAKHVAKLSHKQLYYYLVNADLFPESLPIAKAKVGKLLRVCRLFNPLPFKRYNHQQFDTYIKTLYQREMKAYQPLQGKPNISKEAYVWGLEQVAPMILIDGCWLQKSLSIQHVNSDISEILFSIYCDELGNGKLDQNHPKIFQQLLDSLSIKVPPVYSAEFIEHPGFIKSAFDLPVYMMGLSHFSVEFLPELLGLNMAIELSGLGKSYMRLVDDWTYWGIDPAIASVHISIDNTVSGHTFLAKKAIQLYMDDVLQRSADQVVLDQHWRRIYTGYASLRFVGWRFKMSLPVCFLINRFGYKLKLANTQ